MFFLLKKQALKRLKFSSGKINSIKARLWIFHEMIMITIFLLLQLKTHSFKHILVKFRSKVWKTLRKFVKLLTILFKIHFETFVVKVSTVSNCKKRWNNQKHISQKKRKENWAILNMKFVEKFQWLNEKLKTFLFWIKKKNRTNKIENNWWMIYELWKLWKLLMVGSIKLLLFLDL